MSSPARARSSRRALALALGIFVAADALLFRSLLGNDTSLLPSLEVYAALGGGVDPRPATQPWDGIWKNDLRLVIWTINRNARVLFTRPGRLFDAEPCFPSSDSLALGEPGISQGVVAAPAVWLTRDPIASYAALLTTLPLISALAMFLLIRDWTGSPLAGIAAGLLYGFHPIKPWDVVHPYVWDTAWTLLALYFAARLFAGRRWRDALALGLCTALQIAGSFYALLAAVGLAVPFLVWLVWRHGLPSALLPRLGLAALIGGLVAWAVMEPYLSLRSQGVLTPREAPFFVALRWVLPGGFLFPGWLLLALAALGLLTPRPAHTARIGDPRWALALGAVLLFALSTVASEPGAAPAPGFHLYRWLAGFVPGLDVIRSPASLYCGVHLALGVLAGLGGAALLGRLSGGARTAVGAALIAAAAAAVLGPSLLEPERHGFRLVSVRSDPEALAFFETLAGAGNDGPLLEVPIPPNPEAPRVSASILLSLHHGRRTSECRNSFTPPEREETRRIARALPRFDAVADARALGFTTILVHHPPHGRMGLALKRRIDLALRRDPDAPLRLVHADATRSAYAIVGAPPPAAPTP